MVNELIETFVEHPRRRAIIWSSAAAFSLLFVLPAWDHFSGARAAVAEHNTELTEISYSLSNLDLLRSKLKSIHPGKDASNRTIDGESAERIRESVTRLTHEMGCRVRRLTMSDSLERAWCQGDNPFAMDAPVQSADTGFELETRTLALSVSGNLAQLTKLTIALTRLDRFAVPSNMTLQREGIDGHLILDVEISLFNLAETYD